MLTHLTVLGNFKFFARGIHKLTISLYHKLI